MSLTFKERIMGLVEEVSEGITKSSDTGTPSPAGPDSPKATPGSDITLGETVIDKTEKPAPTKAGENTLPDRGTGLLDMARYKQDTEIPTFNDNIKTSNSIDLFKRRITG